jgi:hypothetical protein
VSFESDKIVMTKNNVFMARAEARGASRGPGPPARHVNFLLLLGKYEEELIFFYFKEAGLNV